MSTHALHPIAAPGPQLVSVEGTTYPLESARVAARTEGGIAVTTLTQRFLNPHDEPLEVIYSLPLPADGAVLGYTVRMGDRLIRGEIQPREQAARAYRDALYSGRTAGLLEQDRADTFQQRLGNVPPCTPVEVEIEVLQPLRFLAAIENRAPRWEYRFPTVTSVRYEGAPGRVADADRLDVDRGAPGDIPTRVDLEVEIANPSRMDLGPDSPSHDIVVEPAAHGSRVVLAHRARLDRDIVLSWNACAPEVGVRVTEGRGLAGDDGRYALLTIVPPEVASQTLHRDLTVLIDASGSMTGRPLEIAKLVVKDLIHSLDPQDRFEVIAFASEPRSLTRGLEAASPRSTRRALDRLRDLQAGGGTEMLRAIERALAPLREDAQRQIVLVTDGQIGFEHEVLGRLMRDLPGGSRVHAVGIGAAPDRALLAGVAAAGRGLELCASDDETAAETTRRLIGGTSRPVITELTVGGGAVLDRAPERPRDVFAGQPALLSIELDARGGTIELRGRIAGASAPWTWTATVPAASESARPVSSLPIGALYGRQKIGDLELRRAARRDPSQLDAEIEARGMRHRIVSRRTSLVAISEEITVDPNAPRRRERLAVELPDGVSAEGAGLFATQAIFARIMPALKGVTGEFRPGSLLMRQMPDLASPRAGAGKAPGWFETTGSGHGVDLEATIVRIGGDRVTVEIEAPFDGFELPRGGVTIVAIDGSTARAEMIAGESSPIGPHARGLRLKLTLRTRKALALDHGFEAVWESAGEASTRPGGRPTLTHLRASAAREAS